MAEEAHEGVSSPLRLAELTESVNDADLADSITESGDGQDINRESFKRCLVNNVYLSHILRR